MKRPIIRSAERYRIGIEGQTTGLVKRIGKYGRGPASDPNDSALLVRDGLTGRVMTQGDYAVNNPNYRLTVNVMGTRNATVTVTNTATGAVLFSAPVADSWLSDPLSPGTPLRVEASPVSGYTTPVAQNFVLNGEISITLSYTPSVIISPARTTDPAQINWEVTRVLFSAADLDNEVHGPILADGSIQLNPRKVKWDVPGEPTVVIPDGYGRLLRFDRWDMYGGGALGGTNRSGILTAGSGARVLLTETMFFSRVPRAGYAGAWPSRAVDMANVKRLEMLNCSLLGRTSGIRATGYKSSGVSGDGVYVRQVYAENIDGRRVNADGSTQTAEDTAGKERVNFLQVSNCFEVPYIAEYNWVHKNIFSNSDPEDIYNMFASTPATGTGYVRFFLTTHTSTYDPLLTPQRPFHGLKADGVSELPFYGGNGLAGDGGVVGGKTKSASTVPHHWSIEDGYIIGGASKSYYLGIPTGNHNSIRRNKIHACGVVRNPNSPTGYTRYYSASPAIYIIDYWLGRDQAVWGEHEVTDNIMFVATTRGMTSTQIKWYPKSYVNNKSDGVVQDTRAIITGNTALSAPGTQTKVQAGNDEFTSNLAAIETMIQREEAMEQEWHDSQAAAGRVIGCHL